MLINILLIGFSATAVAVYGVCVKVQNIFLIVPHGINNAIIPIIAYNYGAKKPEREKQTFRWAMIFSLGFMLFATLLLELFPEQILRWFNASEYMLAIGSTALRILAVSTLLSVYGLILCAVLQALGNGMASMFLTVSRQAVFLLPLIFLLCKTENLTLVWLAYPLAELLGIIYAVYQHKKIKYS